MRKEYERKTKWSFRARAAANATAVATDANVSPGSKAKLWTGSKNSASYCNLGVDCFGRSVCFCGTFGDLGVLWAEQGRDLVAISGFDLYGWDGGFDCYFGGAAFG